MSAIHWPRRSARCIYCGTRTQAQWQLACFRHRDLLSVDPLVNSRLMPPQSQGEAAHPLKGKGAR